MNACECLRPIGGWLRGVGSVLVWMIGLAPAAVAQPCTFPDWLDANPHPHGRFAMAYDSGRSEIVAAVEGSTWESGDATRWDLKLVPGPASLGPLVYDAGRDVCIQ